MTLQKKSVKPNVRDWELNIYKNLKEHIFLYFVSLVYLKEQTMKVQLNNAGLF